MKLKLFSPLLILTSLLFASPNYAQTEMNIRELYNLCSKFPLNSGCQGRNIPIFLADRPGDEGKCQLLSSKDSALEPCKVVINNEGLTVYIEIGSAIAELDNQRATLEIKIPFQNIFAHNTRIWQTWSRRRADFVFAEIDVGFTLELDNKAENRSNFVKVLIANESIGLNLRSQLGRTTNFSSKVIFQSQLATQVEIAATSDKSAQVRQLLQTKVCIRCDLRGANLQSADLEDANLEGANLEGANLAGARLKKAYLVGANLNGVNLARANLERSILTLASLVKANLESAKLRGANLQSTNLEGAILRNANLNANDRNPTDLKYANLQQADLSQATLKGADLMLANLEGANLQNANLSYITINSANPLAEAYRSSYANRAIRITHSTNLMGTNLCGATMPDGRRSNQGCK